MRYGGDTPVEQQRRCDECYAPILDSVPYDEHDNCRPRPTFWLAQGRFQFCSIRCMGRFRWTHRAMLNHM